MGSKTYPRWSEEDDALLAQLSAQGLVGKSIARRLGRSPEATRSRASFLGIKIQRSGRGGPNSAQICFDVPKKLKQEVAAQAASEGISTSELVRRAVVEFMGTNNLPKIEVKTDLGLNCSP